MRFLINITTQSSTRHQRMGLLVKSCKSDDRENNGRWDHGKDDEDMVYFQQMNQLLLIVTRFTSKPRLSGVRELD